MSKILEKAAAPWKEAPLPFGHEYVRIVDANDLIVAEEVPRKLVPLVTAAPDMFKALIRAHNYLKQLPNVPIKLLDQCYNALAKIER